MEHVFFCTGHELKIQNIVKSEGLYLYDEQGKGYMDLESGVWCTSLGHNNAEILDEPANGLGFNIMTSTPILLLSVRALGTDTR